MNSRLRIAIKMTLLCVLLYTSLLLFIQSAIDLKRHMYVYNYEYKTLGDIGRDVADTVILKYNEYKEEEEHLEKLSNTFPIFEELKIE